MRGTIKHVNAEKQYGFIIGSDGQDYFFHASGVQAPRLIDDFDRGHAVEFDPEQSPRGLRGKNVRPVLIPTPTSV